MTPPGPRVGRAPARGRPEERASRARRLALVAAGAVLILAAVGLGRPRLERAVRARIEREAARRGLVARIGVVRVGLWPPLALAGLRVDKPGAWSAAVETAAVTVRPWGTGRLGRVRLALGAVSLSGPAGLTFEALPTRWDVIAAGPDGFRLQLREPAEGLAVTGNPTADGWRIDTSATDLPAGRLVTVRRDGVPVVDSGTVGGTVRLASASGSTQFHVDASVQALRVVALSSAPPGVGPGFGPPTNLALQLEGAWRSGAGALALTRWRLIVDGAIASGSLALDDLPADPRIDLSLNVERVDFARLFRTSGLVRSEGASFRIAAEDADDDLGSASLSATFKGRLLDPASVTVTQRLDFSPPRRIPAAVAKLRGEFEHEVRLPSGGSRVIVVSPTSPDFIALARVPPLFVRALLLAEDAGFFGHRGIDLSELPPALLTNWSRGGAFRGASTITQQLAKNLFLSGEKKLDRKLVELSLALLLEATLGKERILEIYLNVIEWGPGLHGLRPAAHRYFDAEPGELTPRQMAFLVALIPAPVKYQVSFARGGLSPAFRRLVDDLLAKLHSAGALSDDEHRAALDEELRVLTASPEGAAGSREGTAEPPPVPLNPPG